MLFRLAMWKEASQKQVLKSLEFLEKKSNITIQAHLELPSVGASYKMTYTIHPYGHLKIEGQLIPGESSMPELPRFGFQMELNDDLNELKWYGRGPHENYADRKTSAFIAQYQSTVLEQAHPYICLLYTSPSPRDQRGSRMPSSA